MKRITKAFSKLLLIILILPVAGALGRAAVAAGANQSPAKASQSGASSAGSETEDLKNPNPKIRAKTARELGQTGDPSVVPALAAALSDPSPKVRQQVVIALASIRVSQSLDALISATTDSNEQVRWLAIKGIEGYYTGHAPKSGFMAFVKRQYRGVKRQFDQTITEVPPGTVVSVRAVAALDRAMMDPRFPRDSREAARALGILRAKLAVPDLVTTAHSSDADLAREALNSLSKIRDTSAGPKLIDLLDSPNRGVKQDAAVTIGILRTRAAVPKLQSMYENSPNKGTREKALEGLSYIGDPVSGPIFLKALWDPDNSIQISAAEGLGRSKYQPALPDLLRAAPAEKNAEVRVAMEFAITSLGRSDYLSALINDLGSGSTNDIAQSYLIELARRPGFLSKLYPYMDSRDAEVRRRLCNVLMYSGDSTSVQPLERASHDADGSVAAAALRALAAVRQRVSASAPSAR
ncbi:MAG: HEAT repeat domain-containing protein [Acidobacteria bacterium]|nr:HEAT repeat domain-containing protein [Acidobacteriota bacterium]